jgi:hypothetical protein
MDEHFFDDLAKGLEDGTISRRRALKLVGAAALGAALIPVMPKQAEALSRGARRRCHRKGGVPLEKGNCHCAENCAGPTINCQDNTVCECFETAEGTGFCTDLRSALQGAGCSSSADCAAFAGTRCIFARGCTGAGGRCTTDAQCKSTSADFACIKGHCQQSFCRGACRTP